MTDLQSSESDVSKDLCSCSALLLIVLLCAPDRPWIKAGIIPNSTRCFSVAPPPASRRRPPCWPSSPRIAPAPSTPSRLLRSDPPPPLLGVGVLMSMSEPYLWMIPIRAATRTGTSIGKLQTVSVPAPPASPVPPSCTHPYRTSRLPKPPSRSRRTIRPSSSKRSSLKNPRSWASPSRTGS